VEIAHLVGAASTEGEPLVEAVRRFGRAGSS
jgi:hypothetical protein